jgi:hypothetical protein
MPNRTKCILLVSVSTNPADRRGLGGDEPQMLEVSGGDYVLLQPITRSKGSLVCTVNLVKSIVGVGA